MDFTHESVNNKTNQVIQSLHQSAKLIKAGFPDACLSVIKLSLPVIKGRTLAASPLFPQGLPSEFRQISDQHIKALLTDMRDSCVHKLSSTTGQPVNDPDNDKRKRGQDRRLGGPNKSGFRFAQNVLHLDKQTSMV